MWILSEITLLLAEKGAMLLETVDVLHQLRSQMNCRQSCCEQRSCLALRGFRKGERNLDSCTQALPAWRPRSVRFTMSTAGPCDQQVFPSRHCSDGGRASIADPPMSGMLSSPAHVLHLCVCGCSAGGPWQRHSVLDSVMITHKARWRQH